ncbi:polysaccharide deacetylase family protein [Dactylosporangium sp. NPDC005572]|uniref:polysaccharide deacetylase family protein n=1 Tax=Dactylosporangium sp. NPDC005572 TaxID=3156889 RepID=UPI0033B2CD5F
MSYVALTFDDGPSPGTTGALLDALRAAGARATFFDIGGNAQAHPALVRAKRDAGMWIGNHSWTHPHLPGLPAGRVAAELSQTQALLERLTGAAPRLFRPPYGETDATVRAAGARLGLTEVLWTVDTRDWSGATTDRIVAAADELEPGGVLLMHDGYPATVAAVPRIVAGLRARGLEPGMICASSGRAVGFSK